MEAKVNFAAVGVFVIVLTIAGLAGVLWISSGKYYRQSYDIYETYISESVSGLVPNAPVRYRGVDVGRVSRITLAPDNVEQVRLTLEIEHGTPIKVDTLATLQSQGLTGIAFVELTGGRQASPPLQARPGEAHPVIAATPSLMSRLETSVPVLLVNLNRIGDRLNALLDEENQRAVRSALADLAQLARTLATRSPTIDATLASTARTMEGAARVTEQLPQLVQRVERSADAFDRMAGELAGAGASLRGTLDTTRADVQQFTGEALPEVRELVAELRNLTATLRRVSEEVERNPSVLLRGRQPAKRGPGE